MYSISPGDKIIDHDGIPFGIGRLFNFARMIEETVLSESPSTLVVLLASALENDDTGTRYAVIFFSFQRL